MFESRQILCAAMFAAACTPTLDWRDVRLPDAGAAALFPCKPRELTRKVPLAGRDVGMVIHSCTAGGRTWALATADVADPTIVGAALQALAEAARGNVQATALGLGVAAAVPGSTPNDAARRYRFNGKRPDASSVTLDVVVFARGTRVYQATVLGEDGDADGVATFVDSLKAGR